jgi:hypothetical protein
MSENKDENGIVPVTYAKRSGERDTESPPYSTPPLPLFLDSSCTVELVLACLGFHRSFLFLLCLFLLS